MSVAIVQKGESYPAQFCQTVFLNPLKKVADLISRLVCTIFGWIARMAGYGCTPIVPLSTTRPAIQQPLPDMPRGLRNGGMNCAFNSIAQFLNSDPVLADWLRHPLTADMTLEDFEQFLAGYNPTPELIGQFRHYVGDQPQGHPPIAVLFRTFLENHAQEFQAMRETYENLIRIQEPFALFFHAYDQSIRENQQISTANSQQLRLAIHRVNASINESPGVQEDAPEILTPILNALPNEQRMLIQESYHYQTEGVPAIAGRPDGISVKPPESPGYLTLEIKEEDQSPRLDQMLANYFDHDVEEGDGVRFLGVDGVERRYIPDHCARVLLQAPTALRFQIKRFYVEQPPRTWLTRWFPTVFPPLPYKSEKRETPVEVPEELTLTLANGTRQRFQLTSFINQLGSTIGGGHYTSSRIIDGQRYLMDDSRVTPVDLAAWEKDLQKAYLICYLPIEG